MGKNNLLIIGAVGIGGILFYEWWKKKQAQEASTSGDSTDPYLLPTGTTTLPATTQPSTPNQSATSSGIDPTVYATVQAWAKADGRAPVLKMAAANVPSEYAGMYNIITNFWNKAVSVKTGSAEQVFWDALRTKYDPSHNTW